MPFLHSITEADALIALQLILMIFPPFSTMFFALCAIVAQIARKGKTDLMKILN
jgi:hypothetical protein